jgi:hypothetical protein
VVSPENDAVFWGFSAEIPFQAVADPPIREDSGHRLVIYLDGKPVEGGSITGLHRGTYRVHAAIVAADGVQLIESEPVSFHLRQHSIQNPQRGRR